MRRLTPVLIVASVLTSDPAQSFFDPKSKPAFAVEQPPLIDKCRRFGIKEKGSKIVGKVLGTVGGDSVGKLGVRLFSPLLEVSSILSEAIACRLDPIEQKQAAEATNRVVELGIVGRSAEWSSTSRVGVSGSSTVQRELTDLKGARCLVVTDVVILEGEEARVDKTMCRAKGAVRYVLMA